MRLVYDEEAADMLARTFELAAKRLRDKAIRDDQDLEVALAAIGWCTYEINPGTEIDYFYHLMNENGCRPVIASFFQGELEDLADKVNFSIKTSRSVEERIQLAKQAAVCAAK
jgi:hypothetical protein